MENTLLKSVTDGIGHVIGWVGEVIDALLTSEGSLSALLPLFGIGIAISAILLGVRVIKSFIWGA